MDGDNASKTVQEGQNLYQPDQVIQPGAAPATAAPVITPPAPQPTLPTEEQTPRHVDQGSITWTASEFIAHQKSGSWYALFILGAVATAGLVWFLTRDLFTSSAVAVGIGLLGYYAGKQPHEQTYTLDAAGLAIGPHQYSYNEFRSFSVTQEGAFLSVELTPLKRVAMYTTMYIDPAQEDVILDLLSRYLPMEEAHDNLADNLMRRIHL